MNFSKFFRPWLLCQVLVIAISSTPTTLVAYDGSEAFLHYYAVIPGMKAEYQGVCKSLVFSDAASDTLKNAKSEFDLAIPKLLGGTALPVADGDGAIVLAEQGSAPATAAGIDYSAVSDEGFIIKSIGNKTYITGKNQVGVLRGAFHFLRLMQTSKSIKNLNIVESPYFPFRVLDHWYNNYGSTGADADRLYGGSRAFKMENFGNQSGAEKTRVINYCRMAVSLGLNGMCPDNVNTYQSGNNGNYHCLEENNLKNEKVFADIIGTYGLKYYLSVTYASPKIVTPVVNLTPTSADAFKKPEVKKWWFDKVDMVRSYIKNFGGFLMKVDSEGEDGPRSAYNESQSQGANPIAEALKRYGYTLVWRTFIYSDDTKIDFAATQSQEFADPPQTWDSAIVIRMKDGPRDFQMTEPPHQLLNMPGVRHGMEFQITQEYTGQATHLCWLVPKWKKVLDWDIKGASQWNGAPGTKTHQLLKGAGKTTGGVWGISNLSDAANWTGHFLAQANYYGYGRLAWNPDLSADQIADEWIRCSVDNGYNYGVQTVLKHMLLGSWQAYTDYTIGHSALMPALGNNNHYNIDFDGMRNINFYSDWFMDFPQKGNGIGVERCGNSSGGSVKSDFAHKYLTAALADTFSDLAKCPEDNILFFHHLKWDYKMKGGMTLIQQLQFEHFRGVHEVQKNVKYWKLLNNSTLTPALMDASIQSHVASKLSDQLTSATSWAGTFRTQFGACYSTQVPCQLDIVTPDATKATEVATGATVNLSATLKTQNGTASPDGTFNWSVDGCKAGLTSLTGASTVFSAAEPGINKVKVWDSRWPNQYEEELIFVGDWANASNSCATGAVVKIAKQQPRSLKIVQMPRGIVINSPIAGKMSIVSLQGRVVKHILMEKAGTISWDAKDAAKGLYILRMQNESQTLQSKLFVQ
jgi:alpha-glucuronidase